MFFPKMPFPFRRQPMPEFYRMTCSGCGFEKVYELAENFIVVSEEEEDGSAADSDTVDKLPEFCPKCGKKLKKTKVRKRIFD